MDDKLISTALANQAIIDIGCNIGVGLINSGLSSSSICSDKDINRQNIYLLRMRLSNLYFDYN